MSGSFPSLPLFTWNNRPPASSVPPGTPIRISDVGVAPGIVVVSDGANWVPQGMQLLGRSAAGASVTGTTGETALATVTVPAGLLALNGGLLVLSSWTFTNSANNKTLRLRLGGIAGNQFMTLTNTTSASTADIRSIRNRGAANSQIGSAPANGAGVIAATGSSLPTAAVDTTQSQDLVLSGQLALTSESIALSDYEIWASA